jgi:hypothetical protein
MRILIKSTNVEVKKGVGRASGKAYEIREQVAFVSHNDEVRKVNVPLGRDQSPYAVGEYEISPDSFEVNRFGNLEIGRLHLMPAVVRPGLQAAK